MTEKIEKVERFMTTDGKLFETIEQANAHQCTVDLRDFFDTCDVFYTRSSGTIDLDELYEALTNKPLALQLCRILHKIATNKELPE
jgi:hypothetical protein